MTKSSKATEFHSRRDCWGSPELHILHSRVRYLLWLTCVSPFPRWPHMESRDSRGPGSHESLAGLVPGLSGPVGLGCGVIGGVEESLVFGLFRLEAGSATYSFSTHAFRICCLFPCYLNKNLTLKLYQKIRQNPAYSEVVHHHIFGRRTNLNAPQFGWCAPGGWLDVSVWSMEQDKGELPYPISSPLEKVIQSIRLGVVFWYWKWIRDTKSDKLPTNQFVCSLLIILEKLLIHWIQKARKETAPSRWRFFVGGQKNIPLFCQASRWKLWGGASGLGNLLDSRGLYFQGRRF